MFAPEGWISFRDIFDYFRSVYTNGKDFPDFPFTGDEAFQLTWYFAAEANDIAVCSAMGKAVPVSRALVLTDNEFDHENEHVDLHLGTVGSGKIRALKSFPGYSKNLSDHLSGTYGPFLNLPVIFKQTDFLDYLDGLQREAGVEETALMDVTEADERVKSISMSPRAIKDRILEVWSSGEANTRDGIKAIVAPNQSVRKFRFAWDLAREEVPDISKPGRRGVKS